MQIRFKTGPSKGKAVPVTGTQPIVIGRDNSCGVQVIDRGVSREHAKVVRLGEMVFLHDLGSRNGSFVNGERVKEELLREGDVIRVGATQLVFESLRTGRKGEDDLQYSENDSYQSSLELNVKDLYVSDSVADRESGHFKAICRATNLFQVERDEKVLLDKLLEMLMEYIPAVHAYIFVRDETTGKIAPQAIRRKADSNTVPVSRSILRKVIGESKAILTADAMQDSRFKSGDSIITNNIRSLICVPITGSGHVHGAIYAVNSSLTEAFDESDLQLVSALGSQLALALENLHQTIRRRMVYFRVIGRLISTLEGMPYGVQGHSERVCGFCGAIAEEMNLSEREIVHISLSGLLHDIARMPALFGAPNPADMPSPSEGKTKVSGVSATASEILRDIPNLPDVITGVLAQYENFDGSGFPNQLAGEAIPLAGRIISVASAFDKLLYPSGAPQGPNLESTAVREAFMYLEQRSNAMYDPAAVKALMVSYRHGALLTLKPAAEKPHEVEEAVEEVAVKKGTESLRKALASMSKLNTIRISKEGQTSSSEEDGRQETGDRSQEARETPTPGEADEKGGDTP
ncbi:MAG TPA: HD domain-containing phosphohydrolase [Planctomycetota bacterium]|nr:HD domain-containing phosphohydrolase [Planctomycetota bacterium]